MEEDLAGLVDAQLGYTFQERRLPISVFQRPVT